MSILHEEIVAGPNKPMQPTPSSVRYAPASSATTGDGRGRKNDKSRYASCLPTLTSTPRALLVRFACLAGEVGLFPSGPPTAVAQQGRWPPVRYPRFPSNSPTQSGPRAKKIPGRYFHPSLHPKWSRSRVSPGDSTKAMHRARQNTQSRVILWSYHLICGALLVQLPSQKR